MKLRENWYRDVWLAIISLVCVGTIFFGRAEIEESRRDAIVRACQEQNARNMKAVTVLDRIIAGLPAGDEHDRAVRSRAGTVALIAAIAPTQNCNAKAERLIR